VVPPHQRLSSGWESLDFSRFREHTRWTAIGDFAGIRVLSVIAVSRSVRS